MILREKVPAFERVLWRACRGNVFLRYAQIEVPFEDPVTVTLAYARHVDIAVHDNTCILFLQGDEVNKSVFVIFFQGDQLKSRVKKICEG